MTERERYLESLLFGRPDKVFFAPGGPRESTLRRWRSEGLPENADWPEYLAGQIGIESPASGSERIGLEVSFTVLPEFEEKVLEHKDGHYIVQSFRGEVLEISDEFDPTYTRSAKDFVTRKYHKFPVENEDDFEKMKERFNPDTPGRFPEDFRERCLKLEGRDYPLSFQVSGMFWQLRDWCGFENLCMMMVEKPDFVMEMAVFWKDFVLEMMGRIFDGTSVDAVGISEDMAYKEKSMISPAMARRFLMPGWKEWVSEIKSRHDRVVIDLDSDGYIEELIPLWIEAGINCCNPIEIAAGNDILAYRKKFGDNIAYRGAMDKRLIARGGGELETEMRRIIPRMLEGGGYIPTCDHGVPSDISWGNFVEYSRILAELTGWL